ncbi:LuxR family transcriptional regulator [Streptomonospora alba]|uniref:LuxR family transcriptional regulator n=2 Tax=Streptomonospora alba TaxID=183763 RepID=A0A0C2JSI0_9ACTN|nr:LuxR family transcriptional regulator [Streptomonospora alba]
MLVDDQTLMRRGLRRLLDAEPGIEVAGERGDGVEAREFIAAAPVPPDVALVDARMPRMDGITLVELLAHDHPEVASIILTTFDEDEYVFGGLRAGARGHLLKDTSPDDLVAAILRAHRGETVLGATAAERLVGELRRSRPHAPDQPGPDAPADRGSSPLSERESEVARLVGAGIDNRGIARRLHLSEGTVKNHIANIRRKLALRDRTQLAVWVNRSD